MKIYNLGKQLWIQFSFTANNCIWCLTPR